MKVKTRAENNFRKWMGVEDKEQGPKNQALGNTKVKLLGLRGNVMKVMNLSVMSECNHWKARSVTLEVVLRHISSMS